MNALDFEIVEATNVEFITLLPVTSGGGGEAPIEIVKQNGVVLPIVGKAVDVDAYTTETIDVKVAELSQGIDANTANIETNTANINGLTEQLLDVREDLQGVEERVGAIENGVKVERFAVRYNPKFDTLHRPQGDRAPLLLNRSTIEYIDGKRFFNIDLIYLNYVPSSAPSTGFEQNEILFIFPRVAGRNYSDYSSLLSEEFEPYATKDAVYLLGQYYSVGMITRSNAINYSVTTNNYCVCQLTANGELINNTTAFFKSTSSTQNNVYQISGRYEIASDWTIEEYNDYIFTEANVMNLSVDE